MKPNKFNTIPYRAVTPGETLLDELKERKINQKEFAAAIGMSHRQFKKLTKGQVKITDEIAVRLEHELHIDAYIWLRLQEMYEYTLEAIRRRKRHK